MANPESDLLSYEAVPAAALRLFRMSWQLETWLRQIIYVGLRSSRKDWTTSIQERVRRWPPTSLTADKRMHHMSTAHEDALSYLTLGDLWEVVLAPENWHLFSNYFPPKENLMARLAEIKTIRNRVAHCRSPHATDEQRFDLFLRDLDPGLRRFCLRYTIPGRQPTPDSVATKIACEWSLHGHCTEFFNDSIGWLYANPPYTGVPRLGVRLSSLFRPDTTDTEDMGTIYRLELSGRRGAQVNLIYLLEGALRWRDDVVHAIVRGENEFQLTIPGIIGTDRVVEIVIDMMARGLNDTSRDTLLPAMRRSWPEFVLRPNHVLAMFVEEYDGLIFDLSTSGSF